MKNANNRNKNKENSNSSKKGGRRNNNSTRRGGKDEYKKFEMNFPDKDLNAADLSVLTHEQYKKNDATWYKKLGQIYTDATSIPFNVLAGLPFDPLDAGSSLTTSQSTYTAPGVMSIRLAPTFGVSLDINSPINVAAQNLYVQITKNNNRDGQYDRTDVILLIGAMDSAYMLYEFLNRGYAGFRNISTTNRYYPMNLLHAMRFDTESLQTSLDRFRSMLNLMAFRLSSVNVPDVFSLISRHSWLFSHVYKDADTEKAQAYMYMPDGFYQWTEGTSDEPNSLTYITFEELFGLTSSDNEITLDKINSAILKLLNPILGSSYVGLISADIAKAYSEAGMVKIAEITSDASLEPVYDEWVLMQMANLTQLAGLRNMNVTQKLDDLVSGPYIICNPQVAYNVPNYQITDTKKYLNVRGDSPSNDEVAEATRLIVALGASASTDPQANVNIKTCGTEIVTDITIWYLNYVNEVSPATLQSFKVNQCIYIDGTGSAVPSDVLHMMQQVAKMSAFDWAPTQYMYYKNPINSQTYFVGVLQDLDNYCYLSNDQLKGLNDAIVMSEFYVS